MKPKQTHALGGFRGGGYFVKADSLLFCVCLKINPKSTMANCGDTMVSQRAVRTAEREKSVP